MFTIPPGQAPGPRPVSRGMRTLLYVLTALTVFAGIQLFVLADHTDVFFSWTINPPVTATFVGAGFWSAATVVFWCARQRDWALARVIVPTVAAVATMLLVATLQHLELFHGPLGAAWIEVYAAFPPLLAAIVVQQLAVKGADHHSGERLPRSLRLTLAVQAGVAGAAGALLYLDPSLAPSLWPWELTDLTSKAVGTWLVGTAITAGFVAVLDDRAAMPGWALAQVVLGAGVLFGVARFAGDVDFSEASAWALIAYMASTAASGGYGAWIAWREERFAPSRTPGGVPVELRLGELPSGQPNGAAGPWGLAQSNGRLVEEASAGRR
ncbi:MAG TPA: hypothetical protein VEQ61_06215 [Thermoleophilaceae bacterium]|nr:hypothetical protein [Thermoleophilaceae bacterium]